MEDALVGMSQRTWVKFLTFFNLTLPNCAIKCKITGKRINWDAAYRLKTPVEYNFFEPEKTVDWAEKGVKKILTVWKKNWELYQETIQEKIYEYFLHKNYFLILSSVRFTESFWDKIFIWYTKKVCVLRLSACLFHRDFFLRIWP